MTIIVNGKRQERVDEPTLATVLAEHGADRKGVAVAVDGEVVPSGSWQRFRLRDGADVEVLTAVQGG